MHDLKELLEHIDAPTRAEIIRRCAEYEREIKHLKEQCRHAYEGGLPVWSDRDKLVQNGRKLVIAALNRAGECTVYYCKSLRKFSAITQDVRRARLDRNNEMIGYYTGKVDRKALTEDLYAALES
jgi:hypothetical protein